MRNLFGRSRPHSPRQPIRKRFAAIVEAAVLLAILGSFFAQVRADEVHVLERGAHHQVLQRVESYLDKAGRTQLHTNKFTELATGLSYWDGQAWQLSREEFEVFEGGFVARQLPSQVILNPDINVANAVDLETSDGQHFQSSPLFLALRDATGASVMVAEIRSSVGQLIAPNVVLYDDAFSGGVGAGVRYTVTRSSIEQDVVIFDAGGLLPEDYGLNPNTSVIELWSEFIDVPPSALRSVTEGGVVVDVTVDFGSTLIGQGKAFSTEAQEISVPVRKTYGDVEGRRFLVETVRYPFVKPMLDTLNPAGANVGAAKAKNVAKRQAVKTNKELLAQLSGNPRLKRTASLGAKKKASMLAFDWTKRPGLVLDYVQVNASSLTNQLFACDSTYLIGGLVNLYGTTVWEGGSVLKYTNGAKARVLGPVSWQGSTWRPITLTGLDDRSLGEVIRTNALSGQYADTALELDGNTSGVDFVLQNIRVAHATNGVRIMGRSGHVISHAQFMDCTRAISLTNAVLGLRNALIYNVGTVFAGSTATGRCEHLTIDLATTLNGNSGSITLNLTNSILTAVTTSTGYSGANNTSLASSAGVYQAVGGGGHYLAPGSPYRNVGATTISPTLAADLKRLTTYPPAVLTTGYLLGPSVTYNRTAQRDVDQQDQGYHYDPIDWAMHGVVATNGVTVTVGEGTVLATYYLGDGYDYGLWVDRGGVLSVQGTPANPARFMSYSSAQEEATTNWQGSASYFVIANSVFSAPTPSSLSFSFTEWVTLGNSSGYHLFGMGPITNMAPISVRDSLFHGGVVSVSYMDLSMTNCVLDRVGATIWFDTGNAGAKSYVRNSTFVGGTGVETLDNPLNAFSLRDSILYQTPLYNGGSGNWDHGWNAYYNTGCLDCGEPAGGSAHNFTNSITFLNGALGRFYVATNSPVVNMGSVTNAGIVGLYHYTTSTNQVKEASTVLDVGAHYVAWDLVNNVAMDYDGDGIPDYLEDRNGNGTVDGGESSWTVYNSGNGLSGTPGLEVFTPIK